MVMEREKTSRLDFENSTGTIDFWLCAITIVTVKNNGRKFEEGGGRVVMEKLTSSQLLSPPFLFYLSYP